MLLWILLMEISSYDIYDRYIIRIAIWKVVYKMHSKINILESL